MADVSNDILEKALKLPLDDRARIAAELLASMDGDPGKDVDEAWAQEIARRAGEPESNDLDWEAVDADLAARFPAR